MTPHEPSPSLALELQAVLADDPIDLPRAALVVAKVEYPWLDPQVALRALSDLGDRAAVRLRDLSEAPVRERVRALNRFLYEDEGFAGNRAYYHDFRNSLLNVVLDRRLGIPISLALVHMAVAARCGIEIFGVAFPGHFLLRVPDDAGRENDAGIILDPFNGGREMDDGGCRALLVEHVGDRAIFDRALLQPCSNRQLLARMLNNLKRTYVELRSFPQARSVTDLLLAVDPTFGSDLRDRGLLAYHLDDFQAALRDLETYLKLRVWTEANKDEREQVWEHVKTLRRRVASLN